MALEACGYCLKRSVQGYGFVANHRSRFQTKVRCLRHAKYILFDTYSLFYYNCIQSYTTNLIDLYQSLKCDQSYKVLAQLTTPVEIPDCLIKAIPLLLQLYYKQMRNIKLTDEQRSIIITLRFGAYNLRVIKEQFGYAQIARITSVPYSTVRDECLRHLKRVISQRDQKR